MSPTVLTASDVLCVRDGLEMVWVNAISDMAFVVNVQRLLQHTKGEDIGVAVGHDGDTANLEAAVAIGKMACEKMTATARTSCYEALKSLARSQHGLNIKKGAKRFGCRSSPSHTALQGWSEL